MNSDEEGVDATASENESELHENGSLPGAQSAEIRRDSSQGDVIDENEIKEARSLTRR